MMPGRTTPSRRGHGLGPDGWFKLGMAISGVSFVAVYLSVLWAGGAL